jgi:hypothetical protein
MHPLSAKLHKALEPMLPALCRSLLHIKAIASATNSPVLTSSPSPSSPKPEAKSNDPSATSTVDTHTDPRLNADKRFTALRLDILNLTVQFVTPNAYNKASLSTIPTEVWTACLLWFFQFKHNNFYLSAFKKLFLFVLRSGSEGVGTLKFLIVEQSFLKNMITFYQSKEPRCTLTGFVLELCNHIRLTADGQAATDFLRAHLAASKEWQAFLPMLREATLSQIRTPVPLNFKPPGLVKALTSTGTSSTSATPTHATQAASSETSAPSEPSIDLGSTYAKELGYPEISAAK